MTSFNTERRVYRRTVAGRSLLDSLGDADQPGDAEEVEQQHDPRVGAEAEELAGRTHDQTERVDGGDDDRDAAEPCRARRYRLQDRLAGKDVRHQEQGHLHLVAAEDVAHREPDASQAYGADPGADLGERGDGRQD